MRSIMGNEEILKKAVEKAAKNGMEEYRWLYGKNPSKILQEMIKANGHFVIIFSHSFAKAFWGSKMHYYNKEFDGVCICKDTIKRSETSYCWQYHLQQMVLEPEPLKYLEKFL